jgi:DNA invertase Pin-like site-specific DNA recombinase
MANRIYLRVSKSRQDTKSQDPDLKRWAAVHGECEWYRDKFTGKAMNRPGFTSMMDAARAGDTIVIWRLDRLGRTTKGLTALFANLIERKINLVSMKEGLDLSTPAGRLMCHVLASVAQYETEVRGERVQAGLDAAKANGVKLGRKPGIHTPIKVSPDHRRIILEEKAKGTKVATIARAMNLSRQTIYAVLSTAKA